MIKPEALRRALDSYVPTGEDEKASLGRVRDLLARAADPFTRRETEHVTASAVVARPDGAAYLLVHHRRLNRWLQPGGHVEPEDESLLAAALREAREETGIMSFQAPLGDRILDLDVHPIPAFPNRPPHVHYDQRYLLTTRLDPLPHASDEVLEARWFSLDEALAAGVDASLSRALRKAVSLLSGKAKR